MTYREKLNQLRYHAHELKLAYRSSVANLQDSTSEKNMIVMKEKDRLYTEFTGIIIRYNNLMHEVFRDKIDLDTEISIVHNNNASD